MTFPRSARFLTMLAILTTVSLVCLAGAQSASAKTYACGVPDYPDTKLGGYFTSLSASGFSSKSSACKAGKSLVVAYYKCRRKKGIKGRCSSRVNGYSCTESRPADSQSAEQLNAKVTCKSGSKTACSERLSARVIVDETMRFSTTVPKGSSRAIVSPGTFSPRS